ncbi:MAG: hypothetical protein ACK55Z_14385, partial [bacterium]
MSGGMVNGNQSPKSSKEKMYASESRFTASQLTLKINVYVLFLIIRSFIDPESDFVVAFLVHPGKSILRNGERNSILH